MKLANGPEPVTKKRILSRIKSTFRDGMLRRSMPAVDIKSRPDNNLTLSSKLNCGNNDSK
jgi:hypothetical protein